jgi:hypothetical protein
MPIWKTLKTDISLASQQILRDCWTSDCTCRRTDVHKDSKPVALCSLPGFDSVGIIYDSTAQ